MHMKKCSASALGAEGRRFESCHPDRKWDSYESSCFFLLSWFLGEMGGFRQPERQPEFSMNASVSVVCYKSKVLSNGKSPLMLRIYKDNKRKMIGLGVSILPKYWDFEKNKPTPRCPNKELIEKIILDKQVEYQRQILEFVAEQKEYTAALLVESKKVKLISVPLKWDELNN